MILRLFCCSQIWLIYICLLLSNCYSQETNDFSSCYTNDGIPIRCEPTPETFSYQTIPYVNSTCGNPPVDFCIRDYRLSLGTLVNVQCGFQCNSTSSHPPQLMTDFYPQFPKTWWQSESGILRPETVVIRIALNTSVQVQTVLFRFISLKPDAFYIRKSTDFAVSYEPFHYFATDCMSRYAINPQADLSIDNETSTLCQRIISPAPGQISFVSSLDRPSSNDSIPGFSEALYSFATATDIEVVLDGHYMIDGLNSSDYYYAIEELSVVGKCQCNGHASQCITEPVTGERRCVCQHNTTGNNCEQCADLYVDVPWKISNGGAPFECIACNCSGRAVSCVFDPVLYVNSGGVSGGRCLGCTDNTEGIHCDECVQYYYPQPGVALNSSEYCQSCNCNTAGITDNGDCSRNNSVGIQIGQCYCKTNVEGRTCDTCKAGFYNLTANNPDGCEDCGCHSNLSISSICDTVTGVCQCKSNVIGDKCTLCDTGYYLSDYGTCSPCDCDMGGAIFNTCDMYTGQCTCTNHTKGINCNECVQYYYPQPGVALNSSEYCQPCNCNTAGITDNGDCSRNNSAGIQIGQCYCKTNVEGRTCDTCKTGFYNLTTNNPDGCEDCGCHSNLSISSICDPVTGVCQCKPNVIGDKCTLCDTGYYLSDYGTCSLCDCDVGGAISNICDVYTGQCICRTGVTGQTCSQSVDGRFFPYLDYYLYEAEDSLGLFNFSYRYQSSPDLFTGAGFALINYYIDLIGFEPFTPPVSGMYNIVIRYSLMDSFMWEEAEMRIQVGTETGDGPPSICQEYTGNVKVFYRDWMMGAGQAVVTSLCLRGGRTYDLVLNGFNSGSPLNDTELEVDSMVIFLVQGEGLNTLNNTGIRDQYNNCLLQFQGLATRSSAALATCRDVSFSVMTELFNGTLECGCDDKGASNPSQCEKYGGQCSCKVNVIGRTCDSCAAGSYGLTTMGCSNCNCNSDGSSSEFCNRVSGQCSCLSGVEGRSCDSCIANYYNLTANIGCVECKCNAQGSQNLQCNNDGTCQCHAGVTGDKCDVCLPLYYGFPGCQECNCSNAGSDLPICDIQTGQCSCHSNTQGQTCSSCIQGTFNLQPTNPAGCQPCFCSGLTSNCSSASGFVASTIVTDFTNTINHGWEIISDIYGVSTPQVDVFGEGVVAVTNTTSYLAAPLQYLGNKLSSYAQYIYLNVTISSPLQDYSEGYDIIIEGNGLQLVSHFLQTPILGTQVLTVHLHETAGWTELTSGVNATAINLQTVLIDLTKLYLRVSLSSSVLISYISFNTAVPGSLGVEVDWVEQCICPVVNYTGLSCEECGDGFTRNTDGSCQLCQCNGFSNLCNKVNGSCINCTGNTTGNYCDQCAEGYYGDPSLGIPCLPCPCPLTTHPGQYSPTCQLQGSEILCTNCTEGHVGDQCQICAPSFYGDPMGVFSGKSTPCTTCNCNGNIDMDDWNSCSNITGICLQCLFNTTGDQCQDCLDGYYGDPIVAKNCSLCDCDLVGSVNAQCDNTGKCTCHPNVIGLKCQQCSSFHFNFSSGHGCQSCDCHVNGSVSKDCDLMTGDCVCKSGVTGQRCNICQFGYYKLDNTGCKACGCYVVGSETLQCQEDGSCICKTGVMGQKCDSCIENYFLDVFDGQCKPCPTCYSDLKEDVNITRTHYQTARITVNTIAEQNDPEETFEHKQNYALSLIGSLNTSIYQANGTYGQLHNDIKILYEEVITLQTSNITQISDVYDDALLKASTFIALTHVAQEVMNRTTNELYASQSLLKQINAVTLPEILSSTETIIHNTSIANNSLEEANSHVNILAEQTNNITLLANDALQEANISLSMATLLVTLYNDNQQKMINLESMVLMLMNQVTQLYGEFGMLNIHITETEVLLAMISNDLPILPSENYINILMNRSSLLHQYADKLNIEINNQTEIFNVLNITLVSLQIQYDKIQNLLNLTVQSINQYHFQLDQAYIDSQSANMSSQQCISEAKYILSLLKDFNHSITILIGQADRALQSVSLIQSIANLTITAVQNASSRLQDAASLLTEARPLADNISLTTQQLNKTATELKLKSLALLSDTQSLYNTSISSANTVHTIATNTGTVITNINTLEDRVDQTISHLQSLEVHGLPNKAKVLSDNATETVANLMTILQSTQLPDTALISSIESYINSVDVQFSQVNITAMLDLLEENLTTILDPQLSSLQSQLDLIEKEVNRLQTIEQSLPPDCDSNY